MARASLLLLIPGILSAQDTVVEPKDKPVPVFPSQGELYLWRASGNRVEAVVKTVQPSKEDRLGTLRGEHALFGTEGGTLVRIRGVTVGREKGLGIERSDKKLVFRLYDGRLVMETFETEIVVETPHGRVEGKEAYFLVEVTEGATRVVAIQGRLTFTNSLGTVVIEPEHAAIARKGKEPSEPKPVTVARETADIDSAETPRNLIKNPGFESRFEGWGQKDQDGVNIQFLDGKIFHSGKKSARLDIKAGRPVVKNELLAINLLQDVELVPGKRYLLRAYVRAENRGRGDRVEAVLCMTKSPPEIRRSPPSEGKWEMYRMVFTAKEMFDSVFVTLIVRSRDTFDCSVWLDDFHLAEIPGVGPLNNGK